MTAAGGRSEVLLRWTLVEELSPDQDQVPDSRSDPGGQTDRDRRFQIMHSKTLSVCVVTVEPSEEL